MSEIEPEHPREEHPYRRIYRYASAKYHQYTSKCRAAKESVAHYCRSRREAYGGWEQEKKVLEVLAVVFILVYTGIQGCQLLVIRDQEERQLRAYVFPDHPVINNVSDDTSIKATNPVSAFVVIKNTGITPAYKVVNILGAAFLPFPSRISFGSKSISESIVISSSSSFLPAGAPEQSGVVYVIDAGAPLSMQQKEALKNGSAAIYLFGEITYYDTFGFLHCTRYEYYTGGNAGVNGGTMVNAPEGQEADTDCRLPRASVTIFTLPQVPHYELK